MTGVASNPSKVTIRLRVGLLQHCLFWCKSRISVDFHLMRSSQSFRTLVSSTHLKHNEKNFTIVHCRLSNQLCYCSHDRLSFPALSAPCPKIPIMAVHFNDTDDQNFADLVNRGAIANINPLIDLQPSSLNMSNCWVLLDLLTMQQHPDDGDYYSRFQTTSNDFSMMLVSERTNVDPVSTFE